MDVLRLTFLLAFAVVVAVSGQTQKLPHQAPPLDPVLTTTTLQEISTAIETTPAPNAPQKAATTQSTEPPTTTTESTSISTASTPATTETASTTESTTSTSADVTTKEETTTVAPTTPAPTSEPVAGEWNVTYANDTLCLKLKMAAQFHYDNGKENVTVNVPEHADKDPTSACGTSDDLLVLTWEPNYKLELSFSKSKDSKQYKLANLTLSDGSFHDYLKEGQDDLSAAIGNSYRCNAQENFPLTNGVLHISKVKLQAFMDETKATEFGTEEICVSDDTTSDVVPIAVGCALIALVIIVLIAYIVGRRISRQKGYQSV